MGLLLRYTQKDQSIRSVGDAPHGVLAVASPPEGVTFVVDGSWLPEASVTGIEMQHVDTPGGIPATATPVSVDDVLDGCDTDAERMYVLTAPALAVQHAADMNAARMPPCSVEMVQAHVDSVSKGERVLVVDDLLATGGTAEATGILMKKLGAEVVGYSFVIELGFIPGRAKLGADKVHSLINYQSP